MTKITIARAIVEQALEALERYQVKRQDFDRFADEITALRAALAEPAQSGSCISCGNRMTGSPESFVVATAEVGVITPDGYSQQQVEALCSHKGGGRFVHALVRASAGAGGMNNKNVIALPASESFTPEQALLSMLEFVRDDNLADVLVIGYDSDGELIIRSSKMSRCDAVFMLEKAKQWAL